MVLNEKRIRVLRAVLEDIAEELAAVMEKHGKPGPAIRMEFVVEEEDTLISRIGQDAGSCYTIYDGIKGSERNPVLAVAHKTFSNAKKGEFMYVCFFRPPDPFIIEYLQRYAAEFGINGIKRNDVY